MNDDEPTVKAIQDWRWATHGFAEPVKQSFIVREPEFLLESELARRTEARRGDGLPAPMIVDVPAVVETETYEFTINRSELIPGGNGALLGFSDAFPGKQFLVIPQSVGNQPQEQR